MHSSPVDPRTSQFEIDDPAYQVHFWVSSSHSEEWRLTGAEGVSEVLRWMEDRRAGRDAVVYVEVTSEDRVGLVRLHGTDPTRQG